jgi:hypothetical protein
VTQAVLKEVIGRAVADEQFRSLLLTDPSTALAGYDLSDEERQLLEDVDQKDLNQFAGSLGDGPTGQWVHGQG